MIKKTLMTLLLIVLTAVIVKTIDVNPAYSQSSPPDGAALYAANCARCHNPLASSEMRGRSASQIQNAINRDRGGMGSLSSLTSAQIQAIATALNTTVTPVLTTLNVTPTSASINPGTTRQLTASPLDQNSNPFVGATITWSCNSTPVATVSASGLVTGASVGSATITVTATSGTTTRTATSAITVTAATPVLTSVSVTPTSASINPGTTRQLTASPVDQNSAPFAGATISWSSNNTPVATVSATGLVTGVSVGSATITVTATSGTTSRAATSAITVTAATPPDGAALYAANCARCHGDLASSTKIGATAAQIQSAINSNTGGMGSLTNLTPAQIDAIATVLGQQTPPPPLPPTPITDGPTLYGNFCGSCHGPLASSDKRGRTASQIQNAIYYNTGGMGSLSNLTYTQLQAIAAALTPDTTPPTVTEFSIPTTSTSLTVSITTFTATDNVGVTGYRVTESATTPSASATGWSTTPPGNYTCSTAGAKTLYAWAKDAAGNVSASRSASVTITVADTTPPTVTAFSIPATSSSLTVSITTFTATDNVGVTGHVVTESATVPIASATGWSATAPATYTCATEGAKTLYAWAKDAAGNVSTSLSATVTITASNPPTPPPSAIDLTIWPGQWLKVTMRYQGYSVGKSNSDVSNDNLEQDGNESVRKMAMDHENTAGYLKFVSWDPNQGVLQGELHQLDSKSGQWVSDPIALHLIGGSSTDFLCWTQVNGDFTSGFVVRIQGKEKDGVLKSGTFKTLGGYYFEMGGGTNSSAPGSLAGAISISGSLVPEARVPVPK